MERASLVCFGFKDTNQNWDMDQNVYNRESPANTRRRTLRASHFIQCDSGHVDAI